MTLSRTSTIKRKALEDYRQGHPRLTAFLVLDRDFTVFKRFDYLHAQVLLELQDELLELQERLDRCDEPEQIALNLSSRRQDSNAERRGLLREIKAKLREYYRCVQDHHNLLRIPKAHRTQRQSVDNWYRGNKSPVRSESAFFMDCGGEDDSVALCTKDADDGAGLELLLDRILRRFPRLVRQVASNDQSL